MPTYVVYDTRAVEDPSEATVLEAFDAKNDRDGIQESMQGWDETPHVLYRYDVEGKELVNEQLVRVYYPPDE